MSIENTTQNLRTAIRKNDTPYEDGHFNAPCICDDLTALIRKIAPDLSPDDESMIFSMLSVYGCQLEGSAPWTTYQIVCLTVAAWQMQAAKVSSIRREAKADEARINGRHGEHKPGAKNRTKTTPQEPKPWTRDEHSL